ncbi:MAG: hypothetical protein ACRDQ2_15455 [Gaiellales bacterium]
MEIRDYFGTLRRRAWILLIPPLVAGGVVLAMATSTPSEYRATATVAAPSLIGTPGTPYAGVNGTKSFVADFTALATSERIVRSVAETTGLSPGRILEGLSVREVGTSSVIQVTFRTERKAKAAEVASAVAGETIKFLPVGQVDLTQEMVEEAQAGVTAAEAELDAFTAESGLVVPDRDYQVMAQQVSQLEQQALAAAARGEAEEAARIAAAFPAKRAALKALAPKLATYAGLVDRQDRARQQLADATASHQTAIAFQNASDPTSVVSIAPTAEISRTEAVARKTSVAAAAALLLAIGFVALLEPTGRRRSGSAGAGRISPDMIPPATDRTQVPATGDAPRGATLASQNGN